MDDNLDQLLDNLKLRKIREILDREIEHAENKQLSYSALLARLLRPEWEFRQERSIEHRIRKASLPERWSLDSFPFDKQPGIKAAAIRELASLDFLRRGANLVFVGDTGVGKTGLATGIVLEALKNGHRARFIKAQDLFDEMYASLADRSTRQLVDRLARVDVLLVDEMGYLNLKPEQSNIFFKLMEERYQACGGRSTIITTNLQYDDWYEFLGKKEMVKALLDRLRHRCHTIHIDGPSLRDPEG
jgi:DNA replication protein DnaC